ncbi:hypothetical protein BDV95DRAFT_567267 [Massariosphaeria phaeospora]|uniref:DUF4211 domain-containing protein n=1 Tax=Massariosphaeria phaeospora TaxID=100035 RepID=A0A7C8M8E1_9PLEO|nr:hypothetical protein BDV95DRAFT_567267 [Massariosphaeria phaeospora]
MPQTRSRKRQSRLTFSPTAVTSPRPTKAPTVSTDDEFPSRPSKRRRLGFTSDKGLQRNTGAKQKTKMFGGSENETVSSDSSGEDDDNAQEVVVTKRPRRTVVINEESDGDDDIQPRSKRRRPNRTPSPEPEDESDSEEPDNLQEELDFLRSSPPADKGRLRSTQAKPKDKRQRALDAYKRRRAATGEPSSSAATPGRGRPIIVESDSDLSVIDEQDGPDGGAEASEGEDEEEEDGEDITTNALDMFIADNEDDEFIDDDADAPIGAPTEYSALPIEFSSLSRAKPRELFKFAVEWMVHKKINPAFAAKDEIYALTFRKLDDEVKGLANSKYSSAAWTTDFTRAIRARPDIEIHEIPQSHKDVLTAHCEACNRKSHPASFEVLLKGKPYHEESLEPLADDSDSESEPEPDSDISSADESETNLNGEKPTLNASGERLPPESKVFSLGSTCKANAQMAHTLRHWRYHLNSWVVDYLVIEGHCTPEKLVERDSWSVRKRTKYANKIVDRMEERGEIKKLHRLYKDQVQYASETSNDYKHGWGRR